VAGLKASNPLMIGVISSASACAAGSSRMSRTFRPLRASSTRVVFRVRLITWSASVSDGFGPVPVGIHAATLYRPGTSRRRVPEPRSMFVPEAMAMTWASVGATR
jgi:hypothetical protein